MGLISFLIIIFGPFVFSWVSIIFKIDTWDMWKQMGNMGWVWYVLSWTPVMPLIWLFAKISLNAVVAGILISAYELGLIVLSWKLGKRILKIR